MAILRPFRCVRPEERAAQLVAALPYDVYTSKEAREAVRGNTLSFLNIDRAETRLPEGTDPCADEVYRKARELFDAAAAAGTYTEDPDEAYYIYELTVEAGPLSGVMPGHVQTGIVACASVDDYLNGVVRKHENTREDKERDRIRHVDALGAQTGPVLLAAQPDAALKEAAAAAKEQKPLYDFLADDGIRHRVFKVSDSAAVERIAEAFRGIPAVYIADGHHRAAAAVRAAEERRAKDPGYTGEEPYNYFLSVTFPADELMILPYNRVVKDLCGLTPEDFLLECDAAFHVYYCGEEPVEPSEKGVIGLYMDHSWYELKAREEYFSGDPVEDLDVSYLQNTTLNRVLGILDPRTDGRISFVGGIRGNAELMRLVDEGTAAAFSMYPTSFEELTAVADLGRLMPPKSTWFEPKLRSGLFIHRI